MAVSTATATMRLKRKQRQEKQKQPSRNQQCVFVFVALSTLFAIASVLVDQLHLTNARTQLDEFQSHGFFRPSTSTTSSTTTAACAGGQCNVALFSSSEDDAANAISLDEVIAGGHAVENSYHLRSEVESITHVPSEAKVVVRFKSESKSKSKSKSDTERKCKKPRIFGRLSGNYLSVIYWDTDAVEKMDPDGIPHDLQVKTSFTHTENLDVITGYYNVPAKGRYFIEIIGLFCNDFPFDYDFNDACLENVEHNRLTAAGAHVDVSTTSPDLQSLTVFRSSRATNAAAQVPGYWKWSPSTNTNTTTTATTTTTTATTTTVLEPVPLMTRYQRQNCRNENQTKAVCMETGSLERFEPYAFEWLEKGDYSDLQHYAFNVEPQQQDDGATKNEPFKLCAAGQSHSRVLIEHLEAVIEEFDMTNIEVGQVPMSYPRDMMGRSWEFRRAIDCNVIIVGFGQWSAGKKPNKHIPATPFPDYYNEYKRGIDSWLASNINLVIRKTHYNALGDIKTTCPPLGWRNPTVLDTYNEIARRIANESNVPFLDGGYLMDPMWDSPGDFSHYSNLAGKMEVIYFLRKIIDMNTRFKWERPIHKKQRL